MSVDWLNNIQDGIESASLTYNYPASGATVLIDAPKFTQRTESPGGSYTYASTTDSGAQTKTFITTRPDSSTLSLTRSTNTSSAANGLLTSVEIKNSSGSTMEKTIFSFANDPGGSPQMKSAIRYDDAGVPIQVNFDYDSTGTGVERREFGFQVAGAWVVRRRFHVVFTTAGGAHLPVEADIFDGILNTSDADDVLISKTTYAYDNYAAMGGMEDYQGTANPPGHLPGFNASFTNRGNLTGQTQWTDLSANTTITRLAKVDIFGNITKAQVSCCAQKTYAFGEGDYWNNAGQVTSGDPSGISLTNVHTYDFNTI